MFEFARAAASFFSSQSMGRLGRIGTTRWWRQTILGLSCGSRSAGSFSRCFSRSESLFSRSAKSFLRSAGSFSVFFLRSAKQCAISFLRSAGSFSVFFSRSVYRILVCFQAPFGGRGLPRRKAHFWRLAATVALSTFGQMVHRGCRWYTNFKKIQMWHLGIPLILAKMAARLQDVFP